MKKSDPDFELFPILTPVLCSDPIYAEISAEAWVPCNPPQ